MRNVQIPPTFLDSWITWVNTPERQKGGRRGLILNRLLNFPLDLNLVHWVLQRMPGVSMKYDAREDSDRSPFNLLNILSLPFDLYIVTKIIKFFNQGKVPWMLQGYKLSQSPFSILNFSFDFNLIAIACNKIAGRNVLYSSGQFSVRGMLALVDVMLGRLYRGIREACRGMVKPSSTAGSMATSDSEPSSSAVNSATLQRREGSSPKFTTAEPNTNTAESSSLQDGAGSGSSAASETGGSRSDRRASHHTR